MHFVLFSEALSARYWAIEVGLAPGDIEELVSMVARHPWRQRMRESSKEKIRSIILAADRLAERRRQK